MLDTILTFAAVIGPTLFAIGVEAMSESVRRHRFWRYGIVAFGLILSGLTWLQIVRQEARASIAQENAIERVASETSERVTKAVGQQYQEQARGLTDQIGELKGQLAAQAKDVTAIKKSNIVTGNAPVKVEVTNEPTAPAPPLQVENMRLTWERESSTHVDAPYAIKVYIQTDISINPLRFALICDAPLKYEETKFADNATAMSGSPEISKRDPHIFVMNVTSMGGLPLLRPDAPLVIHLYSDAPLKILRAERGPR